MKFDMKDIIIGVLVAIIFFLVIIGGRRVSFADEMSPAPSPANVPSDLSTSLPSGSLLPKAADEACQTKYGDGWIDFSLTLCKKV